MAGAALAAVASGAAAVRRNMARNRTPETQEKRRRERDRQLKQLKKLELRLQRKAAKRASKNLAGANAVAGGVPAPEPLAPVPAEPTP